jgi:hypothetical protein
MARGKDKAKARARDTDAVDHLERAVEAARSDAKATREALTKAVESRLGPHPGPL